MSFAAGGAATGIGFAGATLIVVGPGIFMFASGAGIVVGLLDMLLHPTTLNPPRQTTASFFENRIQAPFLTSLPRYSGGGLGRGLHISLRAFTHPSTYRH